MEPVVFDYSDASNDPRQQYRVLLADCPDYLTLNDVAERLYSGRERLGRVDAILLRPRVDVPIAHPESLRASVQAVAKRWPGVPVHILSSTNYRISISPSLSNFTETLPISGSREEFIDWLRISELRTLAETSQALLLPKKNWLYRTPNHRYANMFMRVGNVQRTRQAIDSFFFWTLPHLENVVSILSETWSISSIAFNCARLLERYWNHGEHTSRRCVVDILSSYHDRRPKVLVQTREALRRVAYARTQEPNHKTLVLLSAISTGNSFRLLKKTIQEHYDLAAFRFLSLYRLTKQTNVSTLCDIAGGVRGHKFDVNVVPRRGVDTIIEIDEQVYFPKFSIKEKPLHIFGKHAADSRAFFTDYQGLNAVTFHRTSRMVAQQTDRHHGVYVDVRALLQSATYLKRVAAAANSLPKPPHLVIAPPHPAAAELTTEVLRRIFGAKRLPRVISHPDLQSSSCKRALSRLSQDGLLLIVDDVCIKGSRVKRYQRALRDYNFKGQTAYLVGVARPPNKRDWDTLCSELAWRPGFSGSRSNMVIPVEFLVLPDQHEGDCPWCEEVGALHELWKGLGKGDVQLRRLLTSRIADLQGASLGGGLADRVLWSLDQSLSPKLGPSSLFLAPSTARQADTLGAVFSTMQRLRHWEEEPLQDQYPFVNVLHMNGYLGERFNDVVLRCAILRAAAADELRYRRDHAEWERARLAIACLKRANDMNTLPLEFAVAHLARKLPRLAVHKEFARLPRTRSLNFLRMVAK